MNLSSNHESRHFLFFWLFVYVLLDVFNLSTSRQFYFVAPYNKSGQVAAMMTAFEAEALCAAEGSTLVIIQTLRGMQGFGTKLNANGLTEVYIGNNLR
jgi:hypothetical protein